MDQQSPSKKEIAKAFFDYRKGVSNMRNQMNKAYSGYITDNILQRRDLFKYISTVSLAILGLSPFIIEKSQHLNYTIIALLLHIIIIFLIILYLRELLDLEGNELKKTAR
ncbi:MAG: hypothetical protein KGI72_04345 [Patescibacteria group bacterium]|nr:hypothetical protein [Patescibacteria group bacterium]MDE2015725.1 hypothetical protein [Patescibacteria group bacterium]